MRLQQSDTSCEVGEIHGDLSRHHAAAAKGCGGKRMHDADRVYFSCNCNPRVWRPDLGASVGIRTQAPVTSEIPMPPERMFVYSLHLLYTNK